MTRKGLGKGKGKGYYNLMPRDSFIHSLNRRGIKSFKLPIQTAIIVPSTVEGDKPISARQFQKRVIDTRKTLSSLYGGYTSVQEIGGYVSEKDGSLIQEDGNAVVSYAKHKDFESKKDELIDYIINKKKEWKQESIGVIIENDLFYV